MVLTAKMEYMAREMDDSREMLDTARATDRQMRILLGMRERPDAGPEEGVGGPTPADSARLTTMLEAGRLSQADVRRAVEQLKKESQRRLASFQEVAWYITNERSLARAVPSIWPTTGHITSPFGYRLAPFNDEMDGHGTEFHPGVDIANKPDTPVVATADGVVRFVGWDGGYGLMVLIDHGFGYSTVYGHTSKAVVEVGQHVVRGEPIAYLGTTGRSTGPHLHYEVWVGGKPVDPLHYVMPDAIVD
ncbi:MAG: M23 family metallopeptidase [Elusimicrobia bacterium]|nr:M23 family metallopeptidase [Elusimicrobiota bacterium]